MSLTKSSSQNNTATSPLRILLVHNRYKLRGGEDSVFEAERDMLIAAGHNVRSYEITNDAIGENTSKLKLFFNTIWSKASYKAISQILRDFKPDVVHCHNTFPLLSPSIYYACDRAGIPVVQTLHNYRLKCLNEGFLKAKNCQDIEFGILWCNHDAIYSHPSPRIGVTPSVCSSVVNEEQFIEITNYFINNYFNQPNYIRINGKIYFAIYKFYFTFATQI